MSTSRAACVIATRMVLRRPARSLLAALGVALAIGALIVAQSLAERGRARVLAEIRDMGATVLVVSAELSRNRGARSRTGAEVRTLTMADERELVLETPDLAGAAGEFRTDAPIKVSNLARVAAVAGIEPGYALIRGAPIAAGRFFSAAEDREGARVAVIGGQIARDLFSTDSTRIGESLGRGFRIRGVRFSVVGVLPLRGTGLDAFDEDNVVFIPLKTARRRLFQVDYLQRIFVRVRDDSLLGATATRMISLLSRRHHAISSEPLDFRVQDQRRLVNLRIAAARNLESFEKVAAGALVAATALGVFALQVLSVRERWTEIGTRRALGASRRAVFWQFVLESSIVAAAGTILGLASALVVSSILHVNASRTAAMLGAAGCLGAATIAAAVPAWTAASLRPSVVMRQG